MASAEAGHITIKVKPDKLAAMESVKEMIRTAVFEYSEWLDGQGLIVGDDVSDDKRSHDDLVREFLDSTEMSRQISEVRGRESGNA